MFHNVVRVVIVRRDVNVPARHKVRGRSDHIPGRPARILTAVQHLNTPCCCQLHTKQPPAVSAKTTQDAPAFGKNWQQKNGRLI